jgi:hypothetical protein
MADPSIACPGCERSLPVNTSSCPLCGSRLDEPVESLAVRRSWKWQAKATAAAILVAIGFGILVGFPLMRIMKDWHNYVNGRTR